MSFIFKQVTFAESPCLSCWVILISQSKFLSFSISQAFFRSPNLYSMSVVDLWESFQLNLKTSNCYFFLLPSVKHFSDPQTFTPWVLLIFERVFHLFSQHQIVTLITARVKTFHLRDVWMIHYVLQGWYPRILEFLLAFVTWYSNCHSLICCRIGVQNT